jgi:hypothetical protein
MKISCSRCNVSGIATDWIFFERGQDRLGALKDFSGQGNVRKSVDVLREVSQYYKDQNQSSEVIIKIHQYVFDKEPNGEIPQHGSGWMRSKVIGDTVEQEPPTSKFPEMQPLDQARVRPSKQKPCHQLMFDQCFGNLLGEIENLLKLCGQKSTTTYQDHYLQGGPTIEDSSLNIHTFLINLTFQINREDKPEMPEIKMKDIDQWMKMTEDIDLDKTTVAAVKILKHVLDCLARKDFAYLPQDIADLILIPELREKHCMADKDVIQPQVDIRHEQSGWNQSNYYPAYFSKGPDKFNPR